ncbi:MAG: hypothetical protein H6Q90_2624 [Deltaproteobacteria bacterium]|nr:hypothetical protein [Deltaproteobacteria bacterium]
MGDEIVEREFMGSGKSRVWTYLILMILLVAIVIVINVVWKNPEGARDGVKSFLGLPGWMLASIMFVVGGIVFWLGLKIETDWPEAFGAFLIAGAIAWMEMIVGWNKFDLGGLVVLPYIIPIATFALLLMYGMKKSV